MENDKPVLVRTEEGLTLVQGDLTLRGDFTSLLPRIRQGNLQNEFLVKATRLRGAEGPVHVLDATAGMGEDSFLLAAAGFTVSLYERDEVIADLLEDALERAKLVPELASAAGRMELHKEDSIAAMLRIGEGKTLKAQADTLAGETKALQVQADTLTGEAKALQGTDAPDVILLDPMFPERQKSALIKKKFQLLQKLERPCSDEVELLRAAMAAGPKKIVIKRPLKGPYLGGLKPSHSITGKAIRYDCLVNVQDIVF